MTLPSLDSATVRAYLMRLGDPEVSLDLAGLSRLQRAHLRALPFHNLALLANEGRDPGLPLVESAVQGNIAGLGGACHLLTPPFVALLRSLGFDAWLAAATVGEPGDHIVGIVRLSEGHFVADVGNGHPYLHPFPLEGGPLDFTAYGWSFRFERDAQEEYRLRRTLPDGKVKTVYRLTPEPRSYSSFQGIIRGHHMKPGFGPFLSALRAVRMTEWALATVRDGLYQRFAGSLESTRPVASWESMAELLHTTFGLPEDLIERALHALRLRAPRLLGEPRHSRLALRFICSLAVTDRAEGATELIRSVAGTLGRSQRSRDSVGVLLLDNGRGGRRGEALKTALEEARSQGLRVVFRRVGDALGYLAPFQQRGLLPQSLSNPLPIGASRTLQACLLHEHLRTRALELPHPGDGGGPVAVWMLDDDLSFRRLRETSEGLAVESVDDLLDRAEALWSEHPEVSVALGTFSGDPPIPGYATLQIQTHDLAGNLQVLAVLDPEAAWAPGGSPRDLPDYYYDHARGSAAHLQALFPWTPPGRAPWTVREAFHSLCAAFTQVPHGRQVTRPLTYQPLRGLAPSRSRGGNALFLDLDALVAAPYPVLRGEDGVMTRRADTLWAHLIAREPLLRLVQADLDLLHGRRDGDGSSPLAEQQPDAAALRRFVEGQERGVVLARLLERAGPVETADAEREVAVRRSLLARSREGVRKEVAQARSVLVHPEAWWWREEADAASARACLAALGQVELLAGAVEALEDPRLPGQLADFARRVVAAMVDWRAVWG